MAYLLFTQGGNFVNITLPQFPYTTEIELPFDFINLDNGEIAVRDEGLKYDKRICKASFFLPEIEQVNLQGFTVINARGKNVLFTVPTNGGFFPFGADKGDSNGFTISLEFNGTPFIQQNPFRYFKCELIFTNVGSYPSYALPTEINDGPWTFGDVTNCRMPQNLFNPEQHYALSVSHTENSLARYFDRGELGDNASVRYVQQCNGSKCAAILYYLTNIARSNSFNVTSSEYFYLFGVDYGSNDTYTVHLSSNKINVKHIGVDLFEIELQLKRVLT